MSSDAKRASNARYLSKFKTVSVRFAQTDATAVQAAADAAGESLNAYIVGAVAQRMDREQPAEDCSTLWMKTLTPILN